MTTLYDERPSYEPRNIDTFQSISDSQLWLVPHILAKKSLTLFAAEPKAGKTTFFSTLFRAIQHTEPFLGTPLPPLRIELASEESEVPWGRRRDALAIHGIFIHCIPFVGRDKRLANWRHFIRSVVASYETRPFDVFIFDTLSYFNGEDENDNSAMPKFMEPLREITELGPAVCLIHHIGAGRSTARGASAIRGATDINVNFKLKTSKADRHRVLEWEGRHEDNGELIIRLSDDGRHYLLTDHRPESVAPWDLIHAAMPKEQPGWTAKDMFESQPGGTGLSQKTIDMQAKQKALEYQWHTTGRGTRGDPTRYYRVLD